MKIYISASFKSQKAMRPWRDKLWELGHQVVGTWLDEIAKPDSMSLDVWFKKLAIKDITEVKEADCLILDLSETSTTCGRAVELGYALATHKLVYLVGKPNGVFHSLADGVFNTWPELLAALPKPTTKRATE